MSYFRNKNVPLCFFFLDRVRRINSNGGYPQKNITIGLKQFLFLSTFTFSFENNSIFYVAIRNAKKRFLFVKLMKINFC